MSKALNLKMILLTLFPCCSPSFISIKGSESHSHYKILANYNGQAELLLSLQIPPDYFPYQFKQRSLYDYLTHINTYLVTEGVSQTKQQLSQKIQERINELVKQVVTFGPSLWNEDLYAGGLVNRNVQFWNTKSADYLFLEQFIIDDSSDPLFLLQRLPKHNHLAITNFRAARDPYSLFSEDIYKYFGNPSTRSQKPTNSLAERLYKYYTNYQKISPNNLFRSGKYMEFWHDFCTELHKKAKESKGGEDLKALFKLPNGKEQLFAPFSNQKTDHHIAKEFFNEIFTEEEMKILKEDNPDSEEVPMNYLKKDDNQDPSDDSVCPKELYGFTQVHHPALEHQTMKGSSPVSEGTQKDLLVYLAQIAVALSKVSQTSEFKDVFKGDPRETFINNAWKNAVTIAKNYRTRLGNIRKYLQAIGVVDGKFDPDNKNYTRNNSKTLAIVSYPPSQLGAGDATIQTISKYPFLYTELGLKEVIPKDWINSGSADSHKDILGVDDNGWWWRLGDFNLSSKSLDSFGGSADSVILLVTEDDGNILNTKDSPKLRSLRSLLTKNESKYLTTSNYHLWNEGLRSPIALNLLLDVLVDKLTKQFAEEGPTNHSDLYKNALDWGNYWSSEFIKDIKSKS